MRGARPRVAMPEDLREPELPNLTKIRAMDRQQHIAKALEMGLSREEAERHADEDLREREEERA